MRKKQPLLERLSNNSAAFSIIAFIVTEIAAAIAALLRLPRGPNTTALSGGSWNEPGARFAYRSAEMERRRNGIADRRRYSTTTPPILFQNASTERRQTPDRRNNPWDLHPA